MAIYIELDKEERLYLKCLSLSSTVEQPEGMAKLSYFLKEYSEKYSEYLLNSQILAELKNNYQLMFATLRAKILQAKISQLQDSRRFLAIPNVLDQSLKYY